MIFITVGTHEQGFNRILKEVDKLIEDKKINEKVFAQIGYSKYKPKNFDFKEMITYEEMDKLVKESRLVITHGGPGSIFHPLQYGKVPIVVPRKPEFDEHVDNHQVLFTKRMEEESKVIAIYDIENLNEVIENYALLADKCKVGSNDVGKFIDKFSCLVREKLKLSD